MGHHLADARHGFLHVLPVSLQQGNAEMPQTLRQLVLQSRQSLAGSRGHQNMLALSQEMPQQIGNGMGLACARRPLHHYGRSLLYLPGHSQLLGIGRLGKQDISRLASGIREHLLLPRLFQDDLGRLILRVHYFQHSLRDFSPLPDSLGNGCHRLSHPLIMPAEIKAGPGIDEIPISGLQVKALRRPAAVGGENGGRALKKFLEAARQGMDSLFIHPGGKFLDSLRLDAGQVLKELRVKFRGAVPVHHLHPAPLIVKEAHLLQKHGMLYFRIQPVQEAGVGHQQFQPLRVLPQPVIKTIKGHEELLGAALHQFSRPPKAPVPLPVLKGRQAHP